MPSFIWHTILLQELCSVGLRAPPKTAPPVLQTSGMTQQWLHTAWATAFQQLGCGWIVLRKALLAA